MKRQTVPQNRENKVYSRFFDPHQNKGRKSFVLYTVRQTKTFTAKEKKTDRLLFEEALREATRSLLE